MNWSETNKNLMNLLQIYNPYPSYDKVQRIIREQYTDYRVLSQEDFMCMFSEYSVENHCCMKEIYEHVFDKRNVKTNG